MAPKSFSDVYNSSDPDAQSLLSHEQHDNEWQREKSGSRTPETRSPWRGFLTAKNLLLHVVLISIYTVVAAFLVYTSRHNAASPASCTAPWSPAHQIVEWEDRRLRAFTDGSDFVGGPSPKVDAAWSDLMSGVNIRITNDELRRIGATDSIALSDGSGYLGSLSVYHELHCVKLLRQWLYKDHYFANVSQHEYVRRHSHIEHCLEALREAISCHSDVTVIPYYWLHDQNEPNRTLGLTIRDDAPMHRCVQFDKVHTWAKSRRVDLRDPNAVVPEKVGVGQQSER
ncbi:hypothetical protein F5Y19DRAFT_479477 [Xylariaceae sp. FL1651]|nr:hypothetical protein F5Y19DRAFT_479477 [Xylariaceae sp. FL1651]